jgi:ribonuclease HII
MAWFLDRLREGKLLTSTEIYDTVGFRSIVGVSINGRKAIAGPVCMSAVMLDPHLKVQYTQPAKDLTEEECLRISADIKLRATSLTIGWGLVDDFIHGPDVPILKGLATCLSQFSFYNPVTSIVIDGFSYTAQTLPTNLSSSQIPIIRAEGASEFLEPCIAASIVAKAARNTIMNMLHDEFPAYGWATNKGFATKQHLKAVEEYGLSGHHRPHKDKPILHVGVPDTKGYKECT